MANYKVLIADDEFYIRKRILKIFPWDAFPVEPAGEAETGREVIEKLADGIDLVLMDIRMPGLDGLETARYIAEHSPSVKVIIFSGYNDFEYAQTAMRYGVLDYLLKPVKEEDLRRAVGKAVQALDRQRTQTHQIAGYRAHERNRLYQNTLLGKKTAEQFLQAAPDLAGKRRCAFAGLYTYGADSGAPELLRGLAGRGHCFETARESENSLLIQFFAERDSLLESAFAELEGVAQGIGTPYYLVLGGAFAVTDPWRRFSERAAEALFGRYFTVLPAVCREAGASCAPASPYDILKIRQKTMSFINTQDRLGLERYLEELFTLIEQGRDIRQMKLVISELLSSLYLLTESPPAVQASQIQNLALPLLEEEYQLEYIRAHLLHVGIQLIEHKDSLPSDIAISRKVASYIDDHYTEAELTVTGIAERFQINVSYMGSVFKRVNKLSVQQYITAVRMDAATALLKQGRMKVSDIAAQVGYSDAFYFSKRFKMMFGVSPKEYNQQQAEYGQGKSGPGQEK